MNCLAAQETLRPADEPMSLSTPVESRWFQKAPDSGADVPAYVTSFRRLTDKRFLDMASTLVSSRQPVENIVPVFAGIYDFKDYVAVSSFLRGNQCLFPLLLEAWRRIENHFGTDTPIALEVFTDPESEGDTQLVALIQTSLPPVEAVAALSRFDREWWLAASSESSGRLCIHVCCS